MTTEQTGRKLSPAEARQILEGTNTDVSDTRSPLRHFHGRLVDIEVTEREGQRGSFLSLDFMFDQLDVHYAVSDYQYGTGKLTFSLSDSKKQISSKTELGILINRVSAMSGQNVSIWSLVGKTLEIDYTPDHTRVKQDSTVPSGFSDYLTPGYEIISLNGAGLPPQGIAGIPSIPSQPGAVVDMSNPVQANMAYLVSLAVGKTNMEFRMAAMADEVIRHNPLLVSVIADNTSGVIDQMVDSGLVQFVGDKETGRFMPLA